MCAVWVASCSLLFMVFRLLVSVYSKKPLPASGLLKPGCKAKQLDFMPSGKKLWEFYYHLYSRLASLFSNQPNSVKLSRTMVANVHLLHPPLICNKEQVLWHLYLYLKLPKLCARVSLSFCQDAHFYLFLCQPCTYSIFSSLISAPVLINFSLLLGSASLLISVFLFPTSLILVIHWPEIPILCSLSHSAVIETCPSWVLS